MAPDFLTVPPVRVMPWVSEHHKGCPPGGSRGLDWTGRGDQPSVEGEISCPSARKSVSAYGEVGMSAVSRPLHAALKRCVRA